MGESFMNATESLFVRFDSTVGLEWVARSAWGPPRGRRVSKQPLSALIGIAGSSFKFSMRLLR